MGIASAIAGEINRRLPDVKCGSLAVFGVIFGGRVDNIHTIVSARAFEADDLLVINFNEDEVLSIWSPGLSVVDEKEFRIVAANRVRWEWFYYGRPKTSDNRYFIEHTRTRRDSSNDKSRRAYVNLQSVSLGACRRTARYGLAQARTKRLTQPGRCVMFLATSENAADRAAIGLLRGRPCPGCYDATRRPRARPSGRATASRRQNAGLYRHV